MLVKLAELTVSSVLAVTVPDVAGDAGLAALCGVDKPGPGC